MTSGQTAGQGLPHRRLRDMTERQIWVIKKQRIQCGKFAVEVSTLKRAVVRKVSLPDMLQL